MKKSTIKVLSTTPKVEVVNGISVGEISLLVKRELDHALFIAHIDSYEIEKYLSYDEDENISTFDVTMMEIKQFEKMINTGEYEIQLVPYIKPMFVKDELEWVNTRELLNSGIHPYSFIPIEEYQGVIY